MAMEGSPPLTRGIHSYMAGICYRVRFTPAHAGNTNHPAQWFTRLWVHPRSRGEYVIPARLAIRMIGSPPLTRGIHQEEKKDENGQRFTPAHAGNTHSKGILPVHYKVHPRSRGEYRLSQKNTLQSLGSPPLTRGIQVELYSLSGIGRFTPAHAGNTEPVPLMRWLCWVHPRSRGEYTKRTLIFPHFFKSPSSHFI